VTAESSLAAGIEAARVRIGPFPPVGQSLGRLRPVLLPIATAAAVMLAWQLLALALRIPAVILPTPSDIAGQLWRELPLLLHHAVPTTLDSLMSFALATGLGLGLAVAMTYSPLLRDTLYPNLILFQLVPKVALAPLFVVWLGISSESRVAFATFVSFEVATLRLCRSLTATEWQSFVLVRFPFALPAIFSGMKIAMTMAVIGVIIGEFISAKAGLGFYILYLSSRMETASVFAALFVLCTIGAALFGAVALGEEFVRRSYGRR
jgi:NitT/TauT family transport system permease protein